jgi:hypothetical protein
MNMKSYECLPRKSSTRFSPKESKKSALSRSKSYVLGERGEETRGEFDSSIQYNIDNNAS